MNSKKRKQKRLNTKLHNAEMLPNRLRYTRLKKGLTLQQVANMVGVGANSISRYETGERVPDAITLIKLSNALDVSPDYIQKVSDNPGDEYFKRMYIGMSREEVEHLQNKNMLELNNLAKFLNMKENGSFQLNLSELDTEQKLNIYDLLSSFFNLVDLVSEDTEVMGPVCNIIVKAKNLYIKYLENEISKNELVSKLKLSANSLSNHV